MPQQQTSEQQNDVASEAMPDDTATASTLSGESRKAQTTEDIAIVVSRFADIIMARTFGHNIVEVSFDDVSWIEPQA